MSIFYLKISQIKIKEPYNYSDNHFLKETEYLETLNLIDTISECINFVNKHFSMEQSSYFKRIPIKIENHLPEETKTSALYTTKNTRISLSSQAITRKAINQSYISNKKSCLRNIKKLGLKKHIKSILYHEMAHFLDLIDQLNLLKIDNKKRKNKNNDYFFETSWIQNKLEERQNFYNIQTSILEGMADCFGSFLLYKEQKASDSQHHSLYEILNITFEERTEFHVYLSEDYHITTHALQFFNKKRKQINSNLESIEKLFDLSQEAGIYNGVKNWQDIIQSKNRHLIAFNKLIKKEIKNMYKENNNIKFYKKDSFRII